MQQLTGRTVLITGAAGGLVPHDVTREDDWARVFADAARAGQPVDVLINNAGWYRPNIELREMSLEIWRRHFAINADDAFLGVREALRAMHGRGAA